MMDVWAGLRCQLDTLLFEAAEKSINPAGSAPPASRDVVGAPRALHDQREAAAHRSPWLWAGTFCSPALQTRTGSSAPGPELLDPELLDPELLDPELLDPELLDPELLDPELLDPELLDPELLDPELLDPELLDPDLGQTVCVRPGEQSRCPYQCSASITHRWLQVRGLVDVCSVASVLELH
ncbi:unnamed protein product [Gadus morhua 'NCC']